MPSLATLVTFVAAVLALALTPGPDMMLLLSRGVGQGPRIAFCTALGFTLAGLVQLPLLAVGVASVVAASPLALTFLRYAGAVYLLWRGVQLLCRRRHSSAVTHAQVSATLALRDGVIASLTNPKGLIFLLAFLPQFVDPARGSVTLQLLLLGGTMKAVALCIEGSVALASGVVGRWLAQRPWWAVWQERIAAAVMIGLGLRLALMRDARSAR
jgi:threonine/homoserine/homoserine lactone efflux protein